MGSLSKAPLIIYLLLLSQDSLCSPRFMGCYKENSIVARLMSGDHKNFPGTLTPEICINHCKTKSFKYAGVQYGQECFCSNDRPSFKSSADIADCDMPCQGDDKKKCGGGFRLSVYDIQNKRVNYVQSLYTGCYADSGQERRALRGKTSPDNDAMTPEFCIGYCFNNGYRFAGVQYRRQCFCGDEIEGPQNEEDECDLDCAGDNRLLCGGSWRSSIYKTSIKDESTNGRFLGCFVDSALHRVLSGQQLTLKETNSPRRCMNICKELGFQYAGVQYKEECFCGNKRPDAGKEANENECMAPCPKTGQRACGGNFRIAIYATNAPKGAHGQPDLPQSGTPVILQTSGPVLTQGGGTPVLTQTPVIVVPAVGNHLGSSGNQESHTVSLTTGSGQGGGELLVFTPTVGRLPPVRTTPRPDSGGGGGGDCRRAHTEVSGKSVCQGDLIFQERFNSWTPEIWKHEIFMPDGPDYEFVEFDETSDNVFFKNGKLTIKPTLFDDDFVRRGRIHLEKCTGRMFTEECEREARGFSLLPPVKSARITTKDYFTFKYGKVVIRARLPVGDWVVPELWLEPKDRTYGAGYKSGRIRIAVSLGNQRLSYNGEEIGSQRLEAGILMGTENRIRGRKLIKMNEENKGWYEKFHNFTLIWSPDNIEFQIDNGDVESLIPKNAGKLYQLVGFDRNSVGEWSQGSPIAPFDQLFYLSLGVTVGGMREFPDNCITGRNHAKPWNNMAVKGLVDFWNDRENWFSTWNDKLTSLEVEDVSVYAL